MATLEDLLYINDYTLPSLFRRSVETIQQREQTQEDIVEPMSDGAALGGGALMMSVSSLISSFIIIYSQYILVKCYCDDFVGYIFIFFILMMFPYIAIPYLFYKRFFGDCSFFQ